MEMSSPRRLEARHAGTSSNLGKLPTDARPAARMILAFFVVDVTIPRTIQDIWCTSVFLWAIAAVVTAVMQRLGDYRYTARYIHRMERDRRERIKGRMPRCPRSWLNPYV
jgi:hypothetical protein